MTSESRSDQPSAKAQSAAARMRRYRLRQRRGQRIVRVQIGPNEIETLISKGFLGPNDREDIGAIEFGMSCLVDETLGAL
jgi:hypothetical protein